MAWTDLLPYLAGLPGIAALITVWIALSKKPHETRSLDGNAANQFAQAAGQVAGQNLTLQDEKKTLEERVETLEDLVLDLKTEIKKLRDENAGLREWAECLCRQVKKLGGNPVKYREKVIP